MLKFFKADRGACIGKETWTDNNNGNFAKVYFRIDTVGFDCCNGSFTNTDNREAFLKEATEIIKSFGVVESSGYKQNNEYLYAHPQNISGIVAKSKIMAIAEAINNSKTMKIRWTDVYEEYAIISDEDYTKILDSKRGDMKKYIIENCFTKRTNLFKSRFEIAINVQEKFKTNRINGIEDINTHKTTFNFAQNVIDQLIENGYLIQVIQYDEAELIRSLNKTEQKKKGIDYESILMGGMML